MLRLFVFLGAAAAAAGCSDTCTHPGVKVIEVTAGDTVQDCSGYGPGLSTPATADECWQTAKHTDPTIGEPHVQIPPVEVAFSVCQKGDPNLFFFNPTGTATSSTAIGSATFFCKCSACPPPASSSSTGTGWTLLGIALGAGSAGGAIAYGAAQAP